MVVVLIVSLVAVAAAMVIAWVCVFGPWRRLRRRSIVVVLDDERTIRGVLWRQAGPLLMIRAAQIATDKGPVAADGMVVVERSRVLWLQVTD